MPLQNRVDPFGAIHAVDSRGMFTGNRGVIHDPAARALLNRRWTTKAWIICALDHPRARRREVMGRNAPGGGAGWTELFFLDEVTALAAGHRPCFYCRRQAAREFAAHFGQAIDCALPRVAEIDNSLHRQRRGAGARLEYMDAGDIHKQSDGAMFFVSGMPFALRAGFLLPWSFQGYGDPVPVAAVRGEPVAAITPTATRAVLAAGYRPVWHPSAGP